MTITKLTSGEFHIDFEPLPADDEVISRMRVTKTFTGGLVGTGVGQMISVGTPVEGSAAYCVLERVTGALDGRRGDFLLQHSALLSRGESELVVTVVPDSGTDELIGLRGTFTIENLGPVHRYVGDYVIEPS